jgi:hypothetical protein
MIMRTRLIYRRAAHWALGAALALVLGLTPLAAQAQTYTDLHDFTGGVHDPSSFSGLNDASWQGALNATISESPSSSRNEAP